ncbi:MAG: phage antirepressor KilAC domain-containing protein [Christensenellales bacterium]|jgi:anti-repressor protein
MNQITVFHHQQFGQVRSLVLGGEPWFVAADVCRALDIINNRDAMSRLDEDEKGVALTDTPGGMQEMTVVNEPGLYALVLGSRKPEAKAFKRWITHEVIPSIRKHGFYGTDVAIERMLGDPDAAITMLQAYKAEREERQRLAAQAALDAPKVLFAESVAASHQSILIGELAKLLKQNGVDVGQNRLFEWLRRDGFLMKYGESRNMPTQHAMENGWMEIKERTISNPDGSIRLTRTPKVTGKGQQYFINRYLKS